ncbi:DUF1593 domain-containing protein [Ruania zhangjianzhongii]|uniref:DUF1593 domain-containing protein n=1 Tax=Ruania zhangjianzhongii TaxID=2603206 RepID=UPI0011CC280F|nr:DUF1593 domain-containing protein [Ruania zhangjianzhongii]
MPASRPRVLVSTDIGGTDPDDFQSMVHLLLYADVLDIEGLIASPYGKGRAADIHRVIDHYAHDLDQLRRHADYPDPAALRAVVKQGSEHLADHTGATGATEGSEWIVQRARDGDPRLLEVLVWGGLDDVAQALHDAPDIADRLRVHYIGGPNTMWSVNAYDYLEQQHPTLRMIESNSTYRGFFEQHPEDPEGPDNAEFVRRHAAGNGALGAFFAAQLPELKMGDSPTVTWLLHGPRDPAVPSWGGKFVPLWAGRKRTFDRLTTIDDLVEVNAVVEISLLKSADYSEADHARLVVDERMQGPFPAGIDEGEQLRFRLSVYHAGVVTYRVQSSHAELDGLAGSLTAVLPSVATAATASTRHPRWWSDDPDPDQAIGPWPGARWISAYRQEFLGDFAKRLGWCGP